MLKLNNAFKVYIINMPKDKERKEYIQKLCDNYSSYIDLEFIEAVDGSKMGSYSFSESYNRNMAINYLGRELSNGEIGCLLSHVFIYHKMIKENISRALILEDDAIFDQKLIDFLMVLENLKKDWDIILCGHYSIYLGHKEIASPISFWNRIKLMRGFSLYKLANYGYGTHGYVINSVGALKLLEKLKDFYLPIDHYTNSREFCNVYALKPTVVKVNTNFISGIERNNEIFWYKKYELIWKFRNLLYYFMFVK